MHEKQFISFTDIWRVLGVDSAPNLLPIRPNSWKWETNISLGATFTPFCLENNMDAFCSPDILAAWTAF
jgi:hypothetical protein